MIRIGLQSHTPHLQGAEKMLLNLAKGLKKSGVIEPVLLIPSSGEGALGELAENDGISHFDLGPIPWYVFVSNEPSERIAFYNQSYKNIQKYRELLTKARIDILLINTLTCAVGAIAAVEENIPYIVWIHGVLDAFSVSEEGVFSRYIHDQLLLSNAAESVFCSRWTANFYSTYFEYSTSPVIYNWTEVESSVREFKTNNPVFVFICPSALNQYKGIDSLLSATAKLKTKNNKFKLYICGAGGEEGRLKQMAVSLGLGDFVFFEGQVDNIGPVYACANCIVMPSYIESFSMVSLEAMAHGKTVIASRSGGPQEYIVDGYNGILFEPGNSDELAEKMEWVMNNQEELNRIGRNAYCCAKEDFDGKKSIAKFIDIIENAYIDFQGYSRQNLFSLKLYKEILRLSTKEEGPVLQGEDQRDVQSPSCESFEIRPIIKTANNMSMSINNNKAYSTEVLVDIDDWSGVGIQVCVPGGECCGVLSLEIYHTNHNTIALRSACVHLSAVNGERLLIIRFPEIHSSKNQKFRISMRMQYEKQSARLHVALAAQSSAPKIKNLLGYLLPVDTKFYYEVFPEK